MRSQITKIALLLDEGGNEAKVESIEKFIAESIDEAVEEELFFTLPTNEIIKIIQKSDVSNVETYSSIISRMCKAKGEETALVLNAVKAEEADFKECVKIVSSLKCSSVCANLAIFTHKMKSGQNWNTNMK